jgi:hypothetical protein
LSHDGLWNNPKEISEVQNEETSISETGRRIKVFKGRSRYYNQK